MPLLPQLFSFSDNAVEEAMICVFIIIHFLSLLTVSAPLNSTVLQLPQPNPSLVKPRGWRPGLTYDNVPSKEDISLIINPHQNLPKHPTQLAQDAKDLDALIRVLTASLKPTRSVAPKSQCWRRKYHYVEANACVKSSFTEQELVDVLSELYLLVNKNGPADLLVDVLIDDTVAALLTLEFDDGSII